MWQTKDANNEPDQPQSLFESSDFGLDDATWSSWNQWNPSNSQASLLGDTRPFEYQGSLPYSHLCASTAAIHRARNPDFEEPSFSGYMDSIWDIERGISAGLQHQNNLGYPEADVGTVDQVDKRHEGVQISTKPEAAEMNLDLFTWPGGHDMFQVDDDKLQQIQGMSIAISGRTSGVASVTPERFNGTNENMTSEGEKVLTKHTLPGDTGPVSWNHIDDEALLQLLRDAAESSSNAIRNDEGVYQSGTSSNTSAIITTPSHSTKSSSDAWPSSDYRSHNSDVLPGPHQHAENANFDELFTAFGGDSVLLDDKPKSSKRRYNVEELEKVNSVRASSACIRCQVMREACSEDSTSGPCKRCHAIESSSRIWKTPCVRVQLTAAELFRTVSLNFPFGSSKITQWHGKDRRQIDLFYPLSNAKNHTSVPHLTIKCRRFRPGPGDVITKLYPTPQGTRVLNLPPFSLIELPAIRNTMFQYVAHNLETFVNELKVGAIGKYFSATFDEVIRLSKSSNMLLTSLHIACMTRMQSRSFGIRGEEDLGIEFETSPHSPYMGRKPIPVMIDREMDLIWRFFMEKKRKMVLSELKRKIMARKRVHWLEIYLTVFVLMSNLEFCFQHQVMKLKRHQAAPRPGEVVVSAPSSSMLDKWQASAENILAHFAVVCQGQYPFTLDWSMAENSIAAGLDSTSTKYMVDLVKTLATIEWFDFERLDPNVARVQPLYWVSKIFQPSLNQSLKRERASKPQ